MWRSPPRARRLPPPEQNRRLSVLPPIHLIRFCLGNLRKRAPLSSSPLHHSPSHPNHRIHLQAMSDLWHQPLAGRITVESCLRFVPASRESRDGSLMKFKLWAWEAIDIIGPYFTSPQLWCVEIIKPWAKAAHKNVAALCEYTIKMRRKRRFLFFFDWKTSHFWRMLSIIISFFCFWFQPGKQSFPQSLKGIGREKK